MVRCRKDQRVDKTLQESLRQRLDDLNNRVVGLNKAAERLGAQAVQVHPCQTHFIQEIQLGIQNIMDCENLLNSEFVNLKIENRAIHAGATGFDANFFNYVLIPQENWILKNFEYLHFTQEGTLTTLDKRLKHWQNFPDMFEEFSQGGIKNKIEDSPLAGFVVRKEDVGEGFGCPICVEDFKEGDEAQTMPCHESHVFHSHCIGKWLARHNTCPTCRGDISKLKRKRSRSPCLRSFRRAP